MEKNDVIEKVEKLMNMANEGSGATQGEIENAIKLANKLMSKYQLSSDDILLGYSDVDSSEIFAPKNGGETGSWRWSLIDTIAKGNLCTTHAYSEFDIVSRGLYKGYKKTNSGKNVTIIGSDLNRRLVISMYKMCVDRFPELALHRWKERCTKTVEDHKKYVDSEGNKLTATRLIKMEILPPKNRFINSYYKGAIRGIKEKLADNVKELAQDDFHKWGLMVVKNDALLLQFQKETVGNIGESNDRKVRIDKESYQKGLDDAKHLEEKQLNEKN